jgi:pantetheine-phosphate adenylyltransferase
VAAPDQRVAVYPGSFDPVTVGHLDIVERGAALFGRLIIAVAPTSSNPEKRPLFTTEARLALLRGACAHLQNVYVEPLEGLLVDFAAGRGARVILRGLRAVSDFEYEASMALMNRRLRPEIDTLYLMASAEHSFISSSLVREVARLGGSLDGLVPPIVAQAMASYLSAKRRCLNGPTARTIVKPRMSANDSERAPAPEGRGKWSKGASAPRSGPRRGKKDRGSIWKNSSMIWKRE